MSNEEHAPRNARPSPAALRASPVSGIKAAPGGATHDVPLSVAWARRLTAGDAADYDAFVERAEGGHFAQSRAWSDLACAGRPFVSSYVLFRDPSGAVVGAAHVLRVRVPGTPLPLPVAVVERGPVVDRPEIFGTVLDRLGRAARRRGILRLSVMPYWEIDAGAAVTQALLDRGWRSVQATGGNHTVTLRLPVPGRDDDALFVGSDHRMLRAKLRSAEREGARARRGSAADVTKLAELHRALMAEQGMYVKPPSWFRALERAGFDGDGPAALFLTEHEGEIVSAALMIRHGRRVTFYMGASARTPRRFSKMAPTFLAAIRWARDLGCRDFDLGGIPAEGDSDEKRLAIAQFKRDFAKTPVRLVGEHARWLL